MAAMTAEIGNLGATGQRHHQHNTVHVIHLLQNKGKLTHALWANHSGLEPASHADASNPLLSSWHRLAHFDEPERVNGVLTSISCKSEANCGG